MVESAIDRLEKAINSGNPTGMTILPDGTIKEVGLEASQAVPDDSPLMVAWKVYKATWAFERSKGWALQIAPMTQVGGADAERQRRFEIMPLDQRERNVEGSLWAAFAEGFAAARGSREKAA